MLIEEYFWIFNLFHLFNFCVAFCVNMFKNCNAFGVGGGGWRKKKFRLRYDHIRHFKNIAQIVVSLIFKENYRKRMDSCIFRTKNEIFFFLFTCTEVKFRLISVILKELIPYFSQNPYLFFFSLHMFQELYGYPNRLLLLHQSCINSSISF